MVKSEVTMPARTRRRYTEEFKREAVRLVRESAHSVAQVARDLGISENVLYRWTAQHRQAEVHGTAPLVEKLGLIHVESRETYGSPSIWDALVKRGHGVGEHRIARLMRAEGIRAKTVKKWRATTQSHHRLPVAANVLNRQFTVAQPNQVWAGDITYVWTTEGWLYLAVVLDLY